jgi:hypothetical protein
MLTVHSLQKHATDLDMKPEPIKTESTTEELAVRVSWNKKLVVQIKIRVDYNDPFTLDQVRHPSYYWRDLTATDLHISPTILQNLTRLLK